MERQDERREQGGGSGEAGRLAPAELYIVCPGWEWVGGTSISVESWGRSSEIARRRVG